MIGSALQCARVDTFPNTTGRGGLPTVISGSTTAACCTCRAQVWVSAPARPFVASGELKLVCDGCKPAHDVRLTPEPPRESR